MTAGEFNFTVQVADASDPVTEALSITINPAIAFTAAAGPLGPVAEAGAAYPGMAIAAAGGTGRLTYSISAGSLPPGLSLSGSGQFTGTALAGSSPGAFAFTVQASDGDGDAATAAYSMTLDPALTLSVPGLGTAFRGTPYSSAAYGGNGGSGSYAYAIASGSVAPLSLNAATGILSGTPSAAATLQFTVAVKDSAGYTATSPPQSLNISATPPLSITQQPASQTANAGANATFTAAASGQPAPTVQWQVSGDGGATFTSIAGATGTTLSLTGITAGMNGNQYEAVFSNGVAPNATSAAATLTVDVAPTVTAQPAAKTVNAGANATFTAAASGQPAPTVQWQVSVDGGITFTPIAGATGTTLSLTGITAGMNGNEYEAVFSNGVAPNATSAAATLTVDVAPTVTAQPASATVNAGANASFTATAGGRPQPAIQWQLSTDSGATFTAVPGATGNTLALTGVAATMNGYEYRAVFSNGIPPDATSAAASLSVHVPAVVTTEPASQTVVADSNATFTAAASGQPTPSIQWFVNKNDGAGFVAIPGATVGTLTLTDVTDAMSGYAYQAVFSNGGLKPTLSTLGILTVQDFTLSATPATANVEAGTSGGALSISVNGANGFSAPVAVSVSGVPAGVSCAPSCTASVVPNTPALISFVAPANALVGNFALTVQGTAGNLVRDAPATLSITSSLFGSVDFPQAASQASGLLFVSGWAVEKIPVTSIQVLVDNVVVGAGFYGYPRPDVSRLFPGSPENSGYSTAIDSTQFSNGPHVVMVQAVDSAGNVAAINAGVAITVNNPPPTPSGPVANLILNAPTTTLAVGNVQQFQASATDGSGNAVLPAFHWSTSDATVAKVTSRGDVLPLKTGTATISVTAGGQTQQVPITVNANGQAAGTVLISMGPAEPVYQFTREACSQYDVPDSPARAVRLNDGSLMLVASGAPIKFAERGADFDSLRRVCTPILVDPDNWTASSFANRQWIFSLYYDGTTLHALVHNEFHDPVAATCLPGDSNEDNPCIYDSVLYASSSDGGHTFSMAAAPDNVVAAAPVPWTPPAPGSPPPFYGSQEPTNIVHAADGYYYAAFGSFVAPPAAPAGGECMMRTQTLSDPTSWRAWDGVGFTLSIGDPYVSPGAANCTFLPPVPFESLTFNTYLNSFMLVGLDSDAGATNCGFHYSLSSDLVHWSTQLLFQSAHLTAPSQCQVPGAGGHAGSFSYASIIDPDDQSASFETPGRTAYIYYTRYNDNDGNWDVVRSAILFTKN